MTWTGAAFGLLLVMGVVVVAVKCIEPAPTRPRLRGAQKLMAPTLLVLGISLAVRPGPVIERYGLLAAVLLMVLADVIEYARAVRDERRRAAAPTPLPGASAS